jgi:CspA family cold shock protein
MSKGKITKIIRDRGFGFIGAEDGREVFFHMSSVVDGSFDNLSEGQDVEFEVEKSQKGPRAKNVRVIQP